MTLQPRKKILYLITKSNWGGAQRYVYDLATNLDRTKFEPVVALGGNGPLVTMLDNAHIQVITLAEMQNSTSLTQAYRSYRELLRIIKTEKPDVLHLNSSIAGLVGALVGRIARIKNIIFTAHGWAFNEDRSRSQKILIKFLHYLTVLLSHRTIAVSSAIVKQMNWPKAAQRMKIINPGRTIGPMYARGEARAKILDFCPTLTSFASDTWIVSIAELHPIKRHTVLLEALAELIQTKPHTRLILIGEGSERSKLESMIVELQLHDHVFLLGNIIEAARFLKAFDVFVLVSKSESYGYVLHEAGQAQVPIIATRVGGIPDIISSQQEGTLIEPDSATQLVSALSCVLTNNQESASKAQVLAQKLSKRSVAVMTQETSYLYELG